MRTDFFDMSPGTILDIIRWLCINLHSKCCCKVRYFALQQCQQCTYVTCTYVTYESVTCTKEELLHVDKTWVTWRCWCNTHTQKKHIVVLDIQKISKTMTSSSLRSGNRTIFTRVLSRLQWHKILRSHILQIICCETHALSGDTPTVLTHQVVRPTLETQLSGNGWESWW